MSCSKMVLAKCGSPSFKAETNLEGVSVYYLEYDALYLSPYVVNEEGLIVPRENDPEGLILLEPSTEKINLSPSFDYKSRSS